MVRLCQRDPRWATLKLGGSALTVGRWGCTTTAVAMLSDYFGEAKTPKQMASVSSLFTEGGLIVWSQLANVFKRFAFEKRLYAFSKAEVDKSLLDPDKAVILEVDKCHWVTTVRRNGTSYVVADPWTGADVDVLKKYGKITGSAHFTRA
jgi:ABC-type bacteriocin/lantibiotic exporter with double-glycine peptidase domain